MKRFFTTIPLLALFLGPIGLLAQMAISGKVTDAGTGEALIGATVTIKGQNTGAATNQDGLYRIQAKGDDVLVVSYTGYQRQEIPVDKRTSIDILLSESESQLDELVVVGYGVQRKSQITGAIASINNKDFKDQPVSNLASSIQGRVTGLNVSTPSGTPGAGLLVSVRGNNAPLYVVDGIPLLAESNSALSTSFNTSGETVGPGQTLSSFTTPIWE